MKKVMGMGLNVFCPDQQWPSNWSDKTAYNNIYAVNSCLVAAPTAGLHFTDKILEQIGDKKFSYLLLHVGAGTFKPLMVQDARYHDMHAEAFSVPVHELKSMIGEDAQSNGFKSLSYSDVSMFSQPGAVKTDL